MEAETSDGILAFCLVIRWKLPPTCSKLPCNGHKSDNKVYLLLAHCIVGEEPSKKYEDQPHISSLVFIVFVWTSACGRCQKNANFCVLDQILIAPISYSASKYCWYITTIKHWPTIRRPITCMWKRFVKLLLESALEQLLLLKKSTDKLFARLTFYHQVIA